ncbi:MAG: cytidylyltransferase domain-containing protein [Acidobacteriota bacterium]
MPSVAMVQARMGSTRLKGKVMAEILGKPMIWHIVTRLRQVPEVGLVVVATSTHVANQPLADYCRRETIPVFRGSEDDVLDRFYQAARIFDADPIIRVTGDCPFVDGPLISELIRFYGEGNWEHLGVATGAGAVFLDSGRYPDGLDAECFSFNALRRAWEEAIEPSDREHVTPYIWRVPGRFRTAALTAPADYSRYRWTVDNGADLDLAREIYRELYAKNPAFSMHDILKLIERRPELAALNAQFIGREGYDRVWEGGATR